MNSIEANFFLQLDKKNGKFFYIKKVWSKPAFFADLKKLFSHLSWLAFTTFRLNRFFRLERM